MCFERSTPVSSVLNADNANGIVAGMLAMQHAVEKAKSIGLSMVVVKNSNHFAAAANFTRLAAREDCIGLCMSNSDALVAFEGGVKPFLGTNPIAFSAPGEQGNSFDLDFATSQVAFSKVMAYLANGQPLEPGWAIDLPKEKDQESQQILKPLGGYKGQGLGLMVQMLTCVLSGMPFDHQLSHLYGEPYDEPRQVSHFMLAINPEVFMPREVFTRRVSQLLQLAEEHTPGVILPGSMETKSRRKREKNGIPLTNSESEFFSTLQQELTRKVIASAI